MIHRSGDEPVLGDPPEPPADVWGRALEHASDPWATPVDGLLPDDAPADPSTLGLGALDTGDDGDPGAHEPTEPDPAAAHAEHGLHDQGVHDHGLDDHPEHAHDDAATHDATGDDLG